jgi:hypothetical protein
VSDCAPCVRCGMLLHTGEGRVTVSLLPDELYELACATRDTRLRERLLCALGLIDEAKERDARDWIGDT